jgi:hypothetical protein
MGQVIALDKADSMLTLVEDGRQLMSYKVK